MDDRYELLSEDYGNNLYGFDLVDTETNEHLAYARIYAPNFQVALERAKKKLYVNDDDA